MPLLNKLDETKLRSVGYGKDKPYITTDVVTGKIDTGRVPLVDTVLNLVPKQINILGTKIDIKNSKPISGVVDTARIGNFLLDLSKGPSFTVKQIALQKMNTIPNGGEAKYDNPLKNANSFFGKIGKFIFDAAIKLAPYPGQLYSPTNTLAQVPLQGLDLHIQRAGLFPAWGNLKYEEMDIDNLKRLREKYHNGVAPNIITRTLGKISSIINKIPILGRAIPLKISGGEILYSYSGGPESLGGLGRTAITRSEITKGIYTLEGSISNYKSGRKGYTYPSSNTYHQYDENAKGKKREDFEYTENSSSRLKDQKTSLPIQKEGKVTIANPRVPFNLLTSRSSGSFDYAASSTYSGGWNDSEITGSLVYKNGYNEEITIKLKNNKISNTSREVRVGAGRVDAVNLTPLFSSGGGFSDTVTLNIPDVKKPFLIRDLVNFRIESIDNNSQGDQSTWMIFRAYLTNLDDNYTSDWNSFRYSGRGENFYIYSGFSRSVSISFKVAASSEQEMMPMYQKLNYLASTMMPEYTPEQGLMRGNYSRLTLGSYFYRQTGIITNLSYKVPNDSPWEIAMDQPETEVKTQYILPHILEVTMTFIPIGLQHNEKGNLNPQKGVKSPVILQKTENTWVDEGQIYSQTSTAPNDGNFEEKGIYKKK